MMGAYERLARPLFFLLPPEGAHRLAGGLQRLPLPWERVGGAVDDPGLRVSVGGLLFPNPVGMAAGFDKDCRFVDSLGRLGFGYVVCGTVTLEARAGNPKPRVARYPRRRSVINAMGFPNRGAGEARRRLQKAAKPRPTLVSVGGERVSEILRCHELLEPVVDGIELNVSCPNVPWGRDHEAERFVERVLTSLDGIRRKPVFVKIPPYRSEREREGVLSLVRVAQEGGADALTASNTLPVLTRDMAIGRGGLSGKAVFPDTLRIVSELHKATEGRLPINACGGIFTAEDALACIRAGASTIQLYTGLIYEGPRIVRRITEGLMGVMGASPELTPGGVPQSAGRWKLLSSGRRRSP
jgi:dihydroorotate dehydrogenase subfamily 2